MSQEQPKSLLDGPFGESATREEWVTVDRLRLRYLRCGSGPNLVLVHGLLGYSFSWRFTIPALSRQATVFAVDMPGAGFSDCPRNLDCRLVACAHRLLQFLDAAGVEQCDLLGTSHGGGVAMVAASMALGRIRRLILVAPVNPWSFRRRKLAVLVSGPLVAPIFETLAPYCKFAHEPFLRRLFGDVRRIRPGTLEGYMTPLKGSHALEYGLGVLRTFNEDLEMLGNVLPRIADIPALLIWGSLDRAVDPASAGSLRKQFKDCQLIMFEGVGHLPYEEKPEEFNRVVSEFLKSSSPVVQPRVL